MPFQFKPAKPDVTVNMIVRIPGWLKNELYQHLAKNDLSMNDWLLNAIHQQLKHGDERPEPRRLPDAAEVISDYLSGRPTIAPCGKAYPCEDLSLTTLGAYTYCDTCNIRIG